MTRGPPTQQHATGDDDSNRSNTPPPRKRDWFFNAIGLSKSKGVENKASNQSLNTQGSPSPPVTKSEAISDIFPKSLDKPEIKTGLPKLLDRIEETRQLVYCNRLIRDGLLPIAPATSDKGSTEEIVGKSQESSPTASQESATNGLQTWKPNEAERKWINVIRQDPIKRDELRWLVTKVVDEFSKDALKGDALIVEVVLVGPVLDRGTYRRLLSCFLDKFERDALLDVLLLQGLIQLVEGASPGYLNDDDLVKTLTVLRRRLQDIHRPSSEHLYQIVIAISRLLDIMVNGSVSGVNRVEQHQPLIATLRELSDTKDPILKFQVDYALQALQYIPNDESVWEAVLRFGGGVTITALGLATVGKLDPVMLFESLDQLREGAIQATGQMYEISKSMLEGMDELRKGRFGAMQSLLHTFRKGSDYEWYLTLLAARAFVRNGCLAEFNRTVCGARCGDKQPFQLGVCQILGEIAMDPLWGPQTRQHAVKFLGALGKTTTGWKQHPEVKQWIVVVLTQISQLSDAVINGPALSVLQDLQQDHAVTTTTLTANVVSYSLKSRLPLPESFPLLFRAQKIQQLEPLINELKIRRLEEGRQPIYIPPMAKANLQSGNDVLFPLMEKVQQFLASEQEVMLILGDSGAGKSTFNQHLEHQLWYGYKKGDTIPLHINLPDIDRPDLDMITKQLEKRKFKADQILELKRYRRFILICDGYDESQLTANLYKTNCLNQLDEWQAKMIISCRSQFLDPVYSYQFVPKTTDHYKAARMDLFQEAVIAPFSEEQIEDYVSRYVPPKPRPWVTKDYMRILTGIPNLMDLVKNPFLLTLSLEALPGVTKGQQDLSTIKITRVELYDYFVDQWLDTNVQRLWSSKLTKEERNTLQEWIGEGFIPRGVDYAKRLALAIFERHNGKSVVEYTPGQDKGSWKATFFGPTLDVTLLRATSPLTRTGNKFRFIHRSMLDYFFSRLVYSPVRIDEKEFDPQGDTAAPTPLPFDGSSPLFQKSLLKDSIIQFLCDRVNLHPDFEQQLRDVIDQSKTDASATIAAINAITILVKAGANFNSADLRNVKIPGADLSGGQFDSAQFQGADLRNVNLARSWLRQANLSGALIGGVQFGELPYLEASGWVRCCAYSPDGKLLAMSLPGKWVEIYDTSSWKGTLSFGRDGYGVVALSFSSDSARIVTGDHRGRLQLWDCSSGNEVLVMTGHDGEVTSVSFSPCGKQVASASEDTTVRLWDLPTKKSLFVLKGHTKGVRSVKFSPDGRQLASGGDDGTIRFWNPKTGDPGVGLSSSLGGVCSLAYSLDGRWIASGHLNGRLQLWNAASLEPGPVLQGHMADVTGIAFSPDSKLMASSSRDRTVRLWDASTGAFITELEGHGEDVRDVAFSPDGSQIASASDDKTVRLWEVNSKPSSSGQKDRVGHAWKAAYSSDGIYIISSDDSTVKQHEHDAKTGAPRSASSELPPSLSVTRLASSSVRRQASSSDGNQIATDGDGGSSQLWDRHTDAAGPVLKGVTEAHMLGLSPCSRWIVSIDLGGNVRSWDLHHPEQPSNLVNTDSEIRSVAFSPGGQQFALGSYKGDVLLFDPESRALLGSKKWNDRVVSTLAYSPNGQQLAVGFEDYSICLWDLQPYAAGLRFQGHKGRITCIAYSPCGQWIASGSEDKTLRLWHWEVLDEVECWSCVSSVRASSGYICDVVWNPVVPMEFITVCKDRALRAWRVSSSEEAVEVTMLWGTNLGVLCAEGLNIQDVDLSPAHQKLLVQRGAIPPILEPE
ncbi:hypothetical protein BGZ47_002267, partial [Haplosporangium gracile]